MTELAERMLEYFSRTPYTTEFTPDGRSKNVPCDLPTIAGFCAGENLPPSKLMKLVDVDTIELCRAKFENILTINGVNRNYDGGFAGLLGKQHLGWSDKTESRVTREVRLLPEDITLLEGLGLKIINEGEVLCGNG